MKMAMGIVMVLAGAMLFHIASHGGDPASITDVWKDFIQLINEGTVTDDSGAENFGIAPLNGGENEGVGPAVATGTVSA